MRVVRVWNQSKRREEFGVSVGIASNPKYLYVRVTTGQTKRFRMDRTTFLTPLNSPASVSTPEAGAAPPTASRDEPAAVGGASNVP